MNEKQLEVTSIRCVIRTDIRTLPWCTTSSRVRRGDNGQEVSQRARSRGGDLHPRSSGQGQPHLTVVSSVVPLTPPQRGLTHYTYLCPTTIYTYRHIYIRSPVLYVQTYARCMRRNTSRFILYQQQSTVSNVQCIHTY